VIVVIAILAAITIVAYNGITNRAKSSAALSSTQQAGKKLAAYALTNNTTLPADLAAFRTATSFQDTSDTTYQYTLNATQSPNLYCLTVTAGSTSAHIAGDATGGLHQATPGPCNGHIGQAPTTLAGGSTCPTGYILVPGNSLFDTQAFCVMKYEAKIAGNDDGNQTYSSAFVPDSRAAGTPWVNITQTNALAEAQTACGTCHLITDNEWLTIAHNVLNVATNWSGGAVGTGYVYSGHNDNNPTLPVAASTDDSSGYVNTNNTSGNQFRTSRFNNGEVIWDFAGNVAEWTAQTSEGSGNQPGPSSGGFSWREWNTAGFVAGSYASSFPAYGTGAAGAWTSAQGIGQINSSTAQTDLRAPVRGGSLTANAAAGPFAIYLNNAPSSFGSNLGFRVVR
ncbi:formylglycine-generating enzyme family protein, partial [Candidatus Saccharibacteria bacterium]|nr:formylglycine-generating enzyme family protein [Candidatus Saccharibacteria bacterium]